MSEVEFGSKLVVGCPAMRRVRRRSILASLLASPGLAAAQTGPGWPPRAVTLVVPFAPGGSNDVVARLLAPHLEARFGQPFVIDNRPGGGGSVGMAVVARARPDGLTMLVSSASNHVFHPLVATEFGYDVQAALAGVAMLADVPNVLAVHPGLGVTTIGELLARVPTMPGGISFASSGVGTSNHFAGELFRLRTGLEMTHVPYRGGGPALADLLAGNVPLGFMNLPTVLPAADAGRLRILAVATGERIGSRPEIPTVREAGVPDYAVRSWTGLFAPRGTPAEVIDAVSAAARTALESATVRARLTDLGSEPIPMAPAATDAFVRAEYARWTPVVRAAAIKPE